MKTRRFDHIDLRVKDMAAAKKFYGQLLPALGFSVASGDDELRTYQRPGEEPEEFFCFEKGKDHRPNETRITEIVRHAGGLKLEGPEVWREYSPGYYAVFFEDPSGNKLEICCRESRPS